MKTQLLKNFKWDNKNIVTTNLCNMFLVCMGAMLNKTEEELKKLAEEKISFDLDWFFTPARGNKPDKDLF